MLYKILISQNLVKDVPMPDEKRRFTRVPFKVEAEIRANNAVYRAEDITNLSVGGCLVPIQADLEVGDKCQVKIWLGGTSTELTIGVEGEVVRSTPGAVAIQFTGVDLDSRSA